ncbi:MAG: M48 family metallopeptidase, partial [Candidatus Binatia bacterium]
LKVLDQALFSPSALDEQRQMHLRTQLAQITQGLTDGHLFQLELRKSERVGPNALALPSGIIVLTDELVLLAEHRNEIIAVLAHEVGHIQHRHALRSLLQNSAMVLLIASVTGDVTSITALSATLPTMLLEAQYSRAFETEADQFALRYLQQHNIPLTHFADILTRMENYKGPQGQVPNYLATHPATSQRVKMFQDKNSPDSGK